MTYQGIKEGQESVKNEPQMVANFTKSPKLLFVPLMLVNWLCNSPARRIRTKTFNKINTSFGESS